MTLRQRPLLAAVEAVTLVFATLTVACGKSAPGSTGGACAGACPTSSAGGAGPATTSASTTTGPSITDTTGPIGLDAITSFDALPYLHTAVRALHESSYDRTGGNNDW